MSNISTQAPTPGQPIPTPPDFPVVWDDPSDARQTWTFDPAHFSEPIAPLSYAVAAAFFVGGNAGLEQWGLPFEVHVQRLNTYLYTA